MKHHVFKVELKVAGSRNHPEGDQATVLFQAGALNDGRHQEWELIHQALEAGQYVIEGGFPCLGNSRNERCGEHHPALTIRGWNNEYHAWDALWPLPLPIELWNPDMLLFPP